MSALSWLGVLAEMAADRALATPEGRASIVGCTPASASDEACFRQFVGAFGRRAIHRPLSSQEVDYFLPFLQFAAQRNDFYVGAKMAIRALLQDGEFAYRVEIGNPTGRDPYLVYLNDWEISARLSYLLWGETPDDALLSAAEAGALSKPEGVQAAIERLLSDPRGIRRVQRFHAMWMHYDELPHEPSLAQLMRTETDALVQRVVFDQPAPWTSLFTAGETYVNATLAQAYGLSAPEGDGFAWVPYTDALRRGILSHGSLLSSGAKNGDSSPTLRGKFVLEELLCSPVPPPPPGINVGAPPPSVGGNDCKFDRYEAHRSAPDCAGCHQLGDGTVLDRTGLVLVFESGDEGGEPHTGENMWAVIAGGVGGLKRGHHVATLNQPHPASVYITLMQALGLQTSSLGEIQGAIPELLA